MNKKYILLLFVMLLGLILPSCKKNDNNPIIPNNPVGSIYISSTPSSAQIWLDGNDIGKVTPDSISNISAGSHIIVLKLTDFLNDTVTVNILNGKQITLGRTMVSDQSITVFGPVQIWDTTGTIGLPSGIILKTGSSILIDSGGKDSVDFYFSSNKFVISTPSSNINNRSTSFFVGLSTNLNDSIESPTKLDSWVKQVQNSETSYFFLFDSDAHYSKMIITDKDNGTAGSPAWIKVKWLYNNKPNDRRF